MSAAATETPVPAPSPRTSVRRAAARGRYDAATVHAILDEAFLCHVAFAHAGSTACVPMVYARIGDALYLHGSTANRMLRALRDGAEACVTVMLLDGLVLARSAFHHSVNYRSVVIYGRAEEVTDPEEKHAALRATVDHVIPGRSDDVRGANEIEFKRTMILRIPLAEASAKVRTGGPSEEDEDYALTCWAGVIPFELRAGPPQSDEKLAEGIETPAYAHAYRRPGAP